MKLKKLLVLSAGVAVASVALASCGGKKDWKSDDPTYGYLVPDGYEVPDSLALPNDFDIDTATDEQVYDVFYGEYEKEVELAEAADNENDRYYHYAKAEAYALNEALFLPMTTQGGRYGMTRIAPGSAPFAYWGTDREKLKWTAVANEILKAEDRQAMLDKYNKEKDKSKNYRAYSDGSHTTSYNAVDELKAKGYTVSKTLNLAITTFPKTFDINSTYRAADSDILCNFTDYLVQYDVAGNIVPCMAESWTVSEDGKTYTFKLRNNNTWVDVAGKEYGKVTAKDFVFGMMHSGDAPINYMFEKIKNYESCAESGDWSTLGVTAVDDTTLKIELSEPCEYFLTYLTYNSFTPINEEYFTSKGAAYGTTFNNILYCGAFYATEVNDKSSLKMARNTKYWDNANTTIDNIVYSYEDGSNEEAMYQKFKNNTYASITLTEARLKMAKADGNFDKYSFVGSSDFATTYYGGFNLNRKTYVTDYDADSTTSPKTDAQKALTRKAMLNSNFRRAIFSGVNKIAYNTPANGEDCALNNVRNTYVPYEYVSLKKAAGGYKAGTAYGAMVLGEMKKLGSLVVDVKDGVNAYYQPEATKLYVDKAWEELGLKETDKVYIDYPYEADSETQVLQANQLKASVEEASGEKIIVNCVPAKDYYTYLYMNYLVDDASEMNYDLDISSGWGPDYGDPSTYINTFKRGGDMIRLSGINQHAKSKKQ